MAVDFKSVAVENDHCLGGEVVVDNDLQSKRVGVLEEDGHLTLSGTSMSMDVYGGWTHNIVDIILYPRHGGGNQKFNKIR